MLPIARHGVLALLIFMLSGTVWPSANAPPASPCVEWIGVEEGGVLRAVCGMQTIEEVVLRHPATEPIRVGDRVVLEAGKTPQVRALSAPALLALGLRLDVNTASTQDLMRVSGIGPALARKIIAKRPYRTIEELERVRGIGPKRRRAFTSFLRSSPRPLLWPSSTPPAASAPRTP
jgi:predicted flap endonuclease-1-like 5' DNA nuclease